MYFQLGPNDLLANLPEKKNVPIKWYDVDCIELCDHSGRMYVSVKLETVTHIRANLEMFPGRGPFFNPKGKGKAYLAFINNSKP